MTGRDGASSFFRITATREQSTWTINRLSGEVISIDAGQQARFLLSVSDLAILHHSRIRLSSQGAFPEHFAPEYGNQIDGEGNGQDPESRPCRSDSS